MAPPFKGTTDTGNLLYGFVNGAVDVFPVDSLPDLCRDNATQIYQTLNDMFKWNYNEATSDITLA